MAKESESENGGGRGKWTALTRYANQERVDQVTKILDEAEIEYRVDIEGRASVELSRIRVPAESLDEAVDAIEEPYLELIPEPTDEKSLSGALGRFRKRRVESHLEEQLAEALTDDDYDTAVDSLWRLADLEPRERIHYSRLVDALIDRGGEGDLDLARLRLEEVMRTEGIGAVAIELSRVATAAGSLDEAEALLDEAASSGGDSAEVAFDRVNLAFARGESRGLKQAASEFRRAAALPDRNWIEIALLLAGADEGEAASRMLGATLRDASDLDEGEWAQAAALKMVIEGADDESREELAELLGEEAAEEREGEVKEWVRDSKRDWKAAAGKAKSRGRRGGDRQEERGDERRGGGKRERDRDRNRKKR